MSILIKGMDMPKHCISEDGLYMSCPMDRLWCMQMFAPEGLTMGQAYEERFGKLPSWCPLVPVPTPHGDLIERNAAVDALELTDWYHQNRNKDMVHGANSAEHQAWFKEQNAFAAIAVAPTIIEAEGEDNGG